MKIFIEIDTANKEGEELDEMGVSELMEIKAALTEGSNIILRDLTDGGLYEGLAADHNVEIMDSQGLRLGRVLLTANSEIKISD
jgi:hypothetical protein